MKKTYLRAMALLLCLITLLTLVPMGQLAAYASEENETNYQEINTSDELLPTEAVSEEGYTDYEFTFPIETEDGNLSTGVGGGATLQSTPITTLTVADGVYALQNVKNTGFWMDVEQGKRVPGYHLQQNQTSSPADSFYRRGLFKISLVAGTTNRYIIRSMLNNRISFAYSDGKIITKEIPANDADVPAADTFYITFNLTGYVIRSYSDSRVITAPNTAASGDRTDDASHLILDTASNAGTRTRWEFHPYTGTEQSGVYVTCPSSWNVGIELNTPGVVSLSTWSTKIGVNTPYMTISPESANRANTSWDAATCQMTLTARKAGRFNCTISIRQDGTEISQYSTTRQFVAAPPIENGGTYFIRNIGTKQYIDLEGPSMAEGANIQQCDVIGNDHTKWILQKISGAYYTVKSVYSNRYMGVDSTATTTIKQYSSTTMYTNWLVEETDSGNYKLICRATESNGVVLATPSASSGTGVNLTQSTYVHDTNTRDEWGIYIAKDLSLIAIPEDYDRSSYFAYIANLLSEIGYTDGFNNHATVSEGMTDYELRNRMSYSRITLVRTHGTKTAIATTGGMLTRNDLLSLPPNTLQYSELVIYGACLTGEGGELADNMVAATVAAGARTAIGFENEVDGGACNRWCKKFFEYYTVYYATEDKELIDVLIATDEFMRNDPHYSAVLSDGSFVSLENYVIAGKRTFAR